MATTAVYPSKFCKSCERTLPLTEFNNESRRKDGKATYCRDCNKKRCREWATRPGNRERAQRNWRRHWGKSRGFANFLRTHTHCQLCGESQPSLLDFHHVDPETKVAKIAEITGLREIIEEAKKCTVLCKDCHKGIHHGGVDGSGLKPLSAEYIDGRFTEYARDFTMKNG